MVEVSNNRNSKEMVALGYKDLGIYLDDDVEFSNLIVDAILTKSFKLFILELDTDKGIYHAFVKCVC